MSPSLTHQARPEGAWLLALLGGIGMFSIQATIAFLILSPLPPVSLIQNDIWFYVEIFVHLLPGITILAAAKILYAKPEHHLFCGLIILIAATIDFFALQLYNRWLPLTLAFLLMTNLPAAVSGVLALLWNPKHTADS